MTTPPAQQVQAVPANPAGNGDPAKPAVADPAKPAVENEGPQGNYSSLSEMEWKSMEVPLENQTKNTHLNLQKWLADRARSLGTTNEF